MCPVSSALADIRGAAAVLHVLLGMCQALEIQEKGTASFFNGTADCLFPGVSQSSEFLFRRPVCLWTLAQLLVAREAGCGGRATGAGREHSCPARCWFPPSPSGAQFPPLWPIWRSFSCWEAVYLLPAGLAALVLAWAEACRVAWLRLPRA